MKSNTLITVILSAAMTVSLYAEPPAARYVTHKSVMAEGRVMDNVVVVVESEGIKFVILPGAIDPGVVIMVYREEGTLTVKSGKPSDHIARLAVDTKIFNLPVEVHIPIKKTDKVPIVYAVDKSDAWERLAFLKMSPDKTTAIFVTHKPVTVAWVTPE